MTDLSEFVGDKDDDTTWLTTKIVAQQFGVHPRTIRNHKDNHPELIDGRDYVSSMMKIDDVNRKVLLWSKSGINKLAQIIRTEEAKEHRNKTLVPIDDIYKVLMNMKPHLDVIPKHEERLVNLEENLVSPVEMSRLLRINSDLRKELFDCGVPWKDVHSIARNWTGKLRYDHLTREELEESIRRLKGAINTKKGDENE